MKPGPTSHPPREHLSSYLDGELEISEQTRLETHLESCRPCARLLVDLRRLSEAMAEEEIPPAPSDLATRITRRLGPEGVSRMERGSRRRRWLPAVPLVAAATLAGATVVWVLWQQNPLPTGPEVRTMPEARHPAAPLKSGVPGPLPAAEAEPPPPSPAPVAATPDSSADLGAAVDRSAAIKKGEETPSLGARRQDRSNSAASRPRDEKLEPRKSPSRGGFEKIATADRMANSERLSEGREQSAGKKNSGDPLLEDSSQAVPRPGPAAADPDAGTIPEPRSAIPQEKRSSRTVAVGAVVSQSLLAEDKEKDELLRGSGEGIEVEGTRSENGIAAVSHRTLVLELHDEPGYYISLSELGHLTLRSLGLRGYQCSLPPESIPLESGGEGHAYGNGGKPQDRPQESSELAALFALSAAAGDAGSSPSSDPGENPGRDSVMKPGAAQNEPSPPRWSLTLLIPGRKILPVSTSSELGVRMLDLIREQYRSRIEAQCGPPPYLFAEPE